jgi:hypothetical protein
MIYLLLEDISQENPTWDGPGWYFLDETGGFQGPYSTIEKAEEQEAHYYEILMLEIRGY